MKTLFASLLTFATLTAMFWFTVSDPTASICSGHSKFVFLHGADFSESIAAHIQAKYCYVTKYHA